jgi:hypothetical protein
MRPKRGATFRFLVPQEQRSGFNHRDRGAEACERLSQLDANRAPAKDRQGRRKLSWNRGVTVGPVGNGVEPWYRRNRRGAAVGDHHCAACDDLLVSNGDGAQVGEPSVTAKQCGAGALDRRCGTPVVEVACHPQHTCGDFWEVDGPFHT